MKTFKILFIISLFLAVISLAAARFSSDRGRTYLKIISAAVPAEPYDCTADNEGELLYVNDTNDTDESYTCFCGIDADDTTYEWFKLEEPNTDCF